MARAFDKYASLFYQWMEAGDRASKLRRELKDVEKERTQLFAQILEKMQNSTEAEIGGQLAFEIVDTERRTTSVKMVELYAPHLYDKMVTIHKGKTLKIR